MSSPLCFVIGAGQTGPNARGHQQGILYEYVEFCTEFQLQRKKVKYESSVDSYVP